MNYHIEVRFEDGIIWIARIRRVNATSPPAALRDYIIQSEVATLMFLKQTNVPAETARKISKVVCGKSRTKGKGYESVGGHFY